MVMDRLAQVPPDAAKDLNPMTYFEGDAHYQQNFHNQPPTVVPFERIG